MQSPRIVHAETLSNLRLLLVTQDGYERIIDCKPFLDQPQFKALMDPVIFDTIMVADGTVSWLDGTASLSPETLWAKSIPRKLKLGRDAL